jgi:uncharacterized protein
LAALDARQNDFLKATWTAVRRGAPQRLLISRERAANAYFATATAATARCNKGQNFRASGIAIGDDLNRFNFANLAEHVTKVNCSISACGVIYKRTIVYLKGAIFLLCATVMSCSSNRYVAKDSPQTSSVMFVGITQVMEPFVHFYRARLPGITFSLRPGNAGMLASVDYLDSGAADVAFTQSDIAYTALIKGTEANPHPHTNIRGLAVMSMVTTHLVVGPDVEFHTLNDLRGKRVGIGPLGSGNGITAQIVLSQSGLLGDVHLARVPAAEVPAHLADKTIDAEFITGEDVVHAALAVPGARLVPIQESSISNLTAKYPFLRPVVIPAERYKQVQDINTVGVDVLFICRDNLAEEIVYRMLTTFFDGIQDLAQKQALFRSVSLSRAPATPIPLHPGAARFYRERELFN